MLDVTVVSPYPVNGDIKAEKHNASSFLMSAHHMHTSGIISKLNNLEVTMMQTSKLECNDVSVLKINLRGLYNTEYLLEL